MLRLKLVLFFGSCSSPRRVAEAQIDVRRVRHARHQFLSDTLSNDSDANVRMNLKILRPNLPDMSKEAREFTTSTPQGPDKLAPIGRGKKVIGHGSL
jgi:hypothetical protein